MEFSICENYLFANDENVATFEHPIYEVSKHGNMLIVVLAPSRGKDCTRNVYGVTPEKGIVWQIQELAANANPPSTYTGFIHRDRNDKTVWIANWSGMSVEIDPATGEVLNLEESR